MRFYVVGPALDAMRERTARGDGIVDVRRGAQQAHAEPMMRRRVLGPEIGERAQMRDRATILAEFERPLGRVRNEFGAVDGPVRLARGEACLGGGKRRRQMASLREHVRMHRADERVGGRERERALALAFRLALDVERQRRLGAEFLAGDAHERPREHGARARMARVERQRLARLVDRFFEPLRIEVVTRRERMPSRFCEVRFAGSCRELARRQFFDGRRCARARSEEQQRARGGAARDGPGRHAQHHGSQRFDGKAPRARRATKDEAGSTAAD